MAKKSCIYCGRIHDKNFLCPKKPIRTRYNKTDKDKFRNTKAWQNKREEIKQRDKGLCQICLLKLYNTIKQYTFRGIEVHHIIPLNEDYSLRLESDNLISLCQYHHELAERGEISRSELKDIIN